MEKLIGHCSFLCLGRRECFAIFGHVYAFIQRYRWVKGNVKLWKSVRSELDTFDGIIPLIHRDLTNGWSTRVHAVDASEYGLGATSSDMHVDEVRQLGQYLERWRFKDPGGCNPRQKILQEQLDDEMVGRQIFTYDDEVGMEDAYYPNEYVNVPFSAVDRKWVTIGKFTWKQKSTLPVYEARSVLYAVKHILRTRSNFNKRHLIFSDSLTAICAISRGCSPGFQLRQVCKQIGALALVSNCQFAIRWIPSEWNPADNPSRGIWEPSSPKRFLSHGHPQTAAVERASQMGMRVTTKCQAGDPHILEATTATEFASGADNSANRDGSGKQLHVNVCQENSKSTEQERNEGTKHEGPDFTGECVSVKAVPITLYNMLGFSESQATGQERQVEGGDNGGQHPSQAFGRDVSFRRGHQCGSIPRSECGLLQQCPQVIGHAKAATGEAMSEGVAQDGSTTKP